MSSDNCYLLVIRIWLSQQCFRLKSSFQAAQPILQVCLVNWTPIFEANEKRLIKTLVITIIIDLEIAKDRSVFGNRKRLRAMHKFCFRGLLWEKQGIFKDQCFLCSSLCFQVYVQVWKEFACFQLATFQASSIRTATRQKRFSSEDKNGWQAVATANRNSLENFPISS